MTYPNLLSVKGVGQKRYEKIQNKMQVDGLSLIDVLTMPPEKIKTTFGLPINVAEAIANVMQENLANATNVPDDVVTDEPDIRILEKGDDDYPERLINTLGDNAPEQLFVWGNLALLNKPAVGFCGSRDVTEKGLNVTADVTKQISELGWVTVSGHARGVDSMAHRVALENNAGTIIVLPQGFNDFKLRSELKQVAKKENLLIISEFPMDARWYVSRAMQRNRTIIALSNAMVLVESREKGGTFNAGKAALKYNHPLFVVDFMETADSNAGNKFFLQKGATRLSKSKTTNRANIKPLRDKVENHLTQKQSNSKKQLAMFELET